MTKKSPSIWAEFDIRKFVIFLVTMVLPAAIVVGLIAWLVESATLMILWRAR